MIKEIHDINARAVDFVVELIDYIFEYPDDDYMTMECLCRKLVKHGFLDKADGYYQTHEIRTNTHECVKDTHDKTESSSEKPNNCEHITEDGVTCAKYPACDDCLDNPLNKVKGSERLVKGSEKPNNWEDFFREPTAEERKAVADYIDSISVPTGVNIFDLMDNSTISKMEQVEEPMKTTDYCDICKRDMCELCVADATNPYCVPSHYEINYEPKDEPITQTKTQNSNLTFEKADEPQTETSTNSEKVQLTDEPRRDCDTCCFEDCDFRKDPCRACILGGSKWQPKTDYAWK